MKIDELNCCVKSILSIFHGFNDLQWKSAIVFFWHELDSTAIETHPRVTTDQQTCWKTRNVETIKHTTFSLKPFILYIIRKTVRFLTSSRRQVSREIHP